MLPTRDTISRPVITTRNAGYHIPQRSACRVVTLPIGMEKLAPQHDIPNDFTSQLFALKLEDPGPCESGSFGAIYRRNINTSEGTTEVAVKVLNIDPGRAVEKYDKAIRREIKVWLRLSKHQTIVPLLGIAYVGFPLPVLVSKWMPSGTLYMYLEKQGTITDLAKADLARGVADGLRYLHSENVVHGDLHPANILIDGVGNPRLIDFGLATVVGDAELQLNTTTTNRSFNPRWRAPEVIGIETEHVRPNFKSDVYSFGGVMFFIVSGDIPWKEKKTLAQIIIVLSNKVVHARPNNILDDHWNLIQKCWTWNPDDRPEATEIIGCLRTVVVSSISRTKRGTAFTEDHSLGQKEQIWYNRPLSMSAKNIVIFGESGVGKSSIINLLAGKQVARTSPDVKNCTLRYEAYDVPIKGVQCRIYDTAGVDGKYMDPGGFLNAIINADKLMKELKNKGGVHLLLYCIKAGRIPSTFVTNYRLFYEFFFEEKVPVALIVTHLERENPMDHWYTRNKGSFDRHAIKYVDHACITAEANLDPKYKKKYDASKEEVCDLIIRNQDTVVDWNGGDGWLAQFIGKLKDLLSGRPSRSDFFGVLTKRCGMEDSLAKDVIQKLKLNG